MTLFLDEEAIKNDPQHDVLLEAVADAIVQGADANTRADIQAARSRVENGEVIVGAIAAGAVSVEFGTRFRYASAPIRRAAEALGLKVPN